jgi:hypothetical protein
VVVAVVVAASAAFLSPSRLSSKCMPSTSLIVSIETQVTPCSVVPERVHKSHDHCEMQLFR